MLSARVFNRGAVRQAARAFNTAEAATDRVVVFDTTLRDGEQSPGISSWCRNLESLQYIRCHLVCERKDRDRKTALQTARRRL